MQTFMQTFARETSPPVESQPILIAVIGLGLVNLREHQFEAADERYPCRFTFSSDLLFAPQCRRSLGTSDQLRVSSALNLAPIHPRVHSQCSS
jgi:hypothetical protein